MQVPRAEFILRFLVGSFVFIKNFNKFYGFIKPKIYFGVRDKLPYTTSKIIQFHVVI
jgi:hypothetical protein